MAGKTFFVIALCIASLGALVSGQVTPAPACSDEIRDDVCLLPNCRCSGHDIPGNLSEAITPQLVFITFDDAVSIDNFPFYEELLSNRKNPNGHPITATFFVTHEYTNYSQVHELWRNGHEIALHSISHTVDVSYWENLNESMWRLEAVDQINQMAQFARIPQGEIKGFRAPLLQGGGDPMYAELSKRFLYDCSRPTLTYRTPGLWPYTNDYQSSQDCQIPPCPVGNYSGFWTVPMIDMIGDNNEGCAMVDTCTPLPETPDETFELLNRNFLDHYNGNRAPFGIYAHHGWVNGTGSEDIWKRREGYMKFLDHLGTLNDTYIVSISRAIEWIQTPTPLANLKDFAPFKVTVRPTTCPRVNNCYFAPEETPFNEERWMHSCLACPNIYPWLGNPLGRP